MPQESDGIIVVDKPAGITSAKVVSILKHKLAEKKVGHTGTLDPFATGVMICCINRATRLARFFLNGGKTYSALLHLGIETDTQDLNGTVISRSERVAFSQEEIASTVDRFVGTIKQVPPVYSALKHKGTPLYKLAREGRPVQKSARQVMISKISICEINLPHVLLEIKCSAGTYIRTLCADIGKALGCGGHLKMLRRTESSGFSVSEAVPLEQTEAGKSSDCLADRIISMSDALRNMPEVIVSGHELEKILQGYPLLQQPFVAQHAIESAGYVKVIDKNRQLISVIELDPRHDHVKYCCVFN